MAHLSKTRLGLVLLGALAALGGAAGIAYATGAIGAQGEGVLTACARNVTGDLRLVTDPSQCTKAEHLVELQAPAAAQPTSFTVDCAAGESVNDVLAQVADGTARVTVAVEGTCNEDVAVLRDDVTLNAASPGSGVHGMYLDEARGIELHGLTIGPGGLGASASTFQADDLHVTGAEGIGVYLTNGSGARLTNPTIEGSGQSGVFAGDSSSVFVGRGTISGSPSAGVEVDGGRANLNNVLVTGNGNGVEVRSGGAANVSSSTIEHNTHTGVHSWNGGSVNVGGTIVRFNRSGVVAQSADANVQGATVSDNEFVGVQGLTGGRVTLQGATVVEHNGGGVGLSNGSVGTLQGGIVIRDNQVDGLNIADSGSLWIEGGGDNVITGNGRWGVYCEPAPATAAIIPGPGIGTVSGNGLGDVSCVFVNG